VRPSKVVTYSGWDSRRVRTSHSLLASLGGQLVTVAFKRRQLGDGPIAARLKVLSSENPVRRADVVDCAESNISILVNGERIETFSARYTLICYGNSGDPAGLFIVR